ncbi:MAG: cyclic nucleotide-binding domain-containing protein [Verrucomicrobiae bacterium]|nr:cyclic nucleotide-binding domain-containing protein [Verrucomicrobiae bacterium]
MKKLSENALLDKAPAHLVAALEAKAQPVRFQPGETIFEEGDPGSEIFLLESGTVNIVKRMQRERVTLLDEVKEGDFFGELALIDQQGRSASAVAATAVTGWKFDAGVVDDFLSEGRESALVFLRTLANKMRREDTAFIRQKEAGERLTLLGNMVGSIVHDLKNPLAAMRMSAELLELKIQDEKSKRISALLIQQIDRMTSMIHDLLEFARNKIEVKKSAGRIDDVASRCRELFNDSIVGNGLELELQLDAPRAIAMDIGKLDRVVSNLVKNAIQAMKGQAGGRITMRSSQTADWTFLEISDNGPGLPESIRALIFEPFVTHGKKDGTGLGLSIVRKIIESHDGRIGFQTETGKGTTFRIELPG